MLYLKWAAFLLPSFFNGNRGQGRCADSCLFCAFRRVVAALAVVVSDPRQQLRRGRRPPRPMAARRVVLDVGETDGVVVPQHGVRIPHLRARHQRKGVRLRGHLRRPEDRGSDGHQRVVSVECLQWGEVDRVAVLLRAPLQEFRGMEVCATWDRLEVLGRQAVQCSALALLSPAQGLGPKRVIYAGEDAHDTGLFA